MVKPLIALDVDGPLNPYAAKPQRRPAGYLTYRYTPPVIGVWKSRPLRVWLNPDHGRILKDLAHSLSAELVWATTWNHEANSFISPRIGLPELDVIDVPHPEKSNKWKWSAVAEYAGDRPLIWFDDDFGLSWHQEHRKTFEEKRKNIPTLLHSVSPRVGLMADDIVRAQQWGESLQQ